MAVYKQLTPQEADALRAKAAGVPVDHDAVGGGATRTSANEAAGQHDLAAHRSEAQADGTGIGRLIQMFRRHSL